VLNVRAASEVKSEPALELSRTPPPNEAMGRITVDAREKEGLHYDAPRAPPVATAGRTKVATEDFHGPLEQLKSMKISSTLVFWSHP
jgi:hypothetical protein